MDGKPHILSNHIDCVKISTKYFALDIIDINGSKCFEWVQQKSEKIEKYEWLNVLISLKAWNVSAVVNIAKVKVYFNAWHDMFNFLKCINTNVYTK